MCNIFLVVENNIHNFVCDIKIKYNIYRNKHKLIVIPNDTR